MCRVMSAPEVDPGVCRPKAQEESTEFHKKALHVALESLPHRMAQYVTLRTVWRIIIGIVN